VALPRGWYLYVGSAFGPGGVAARCNHHRRVSERPRWHIDYLRAATRLRGIWFTHDERRREHQWADILQAGMGLKRPVTGFGASDCNCESHLFFMEKRPDFLVFLTAIRRGIPKHKEIYCEFL
jgi:Uri superfamily endonuclease